jgi:ABC-2 type transport system permease protein
VDANKAGFLLLPTIEIASINWFNPLLNYRFFMVPGILVVLVTMVGAFMCSLNIVKEKEVGTIEQINVTPVKSITSSWESLSRLVHRRVRFYCGLFGVARFITALYGWQCLLLYAYLSVYLLALLA